MRSLRAIKMKHTIIILILISLLTLNCKTAEQKQYDKDSAVKAKEHISTQFPKVNWRGASCGENLSPTDAIGFVDCRVYSQGYWSIPLICTPEKCICEICEQLK